MDLQQIEGNRHWLAEQIRQYVKDQVELWQQFPWLTWEAEGKTGFSSTYSMCYEWGMWGVGDDHGTYTHAVDCGTGMLCAAHSYQDPVPLPDQAIIELKMENLNAGLMLTELQNEAAEPYSTFMGHAPQSKKDKLALGFKVPPKVFIRHRIFKDDPRRENKAGWRS